MPLDLTEDIEQPGHGGQLLAAHRGEQRLDRTESIGCGTTESPPEREYCKSLNVGQGQATNAANLETMKDLKNKDEKPPLGEAVVQGVILDSSQPQLCPRW